MAWLPPRAGDLRDRIAIERNFRVSDDLGGWTDVWQTAAASIRAKVTAQRGGEAVQSLRLSGTTPYDIIVRADAVTQSITSGDRVVLLATGERLNVKWAGSLDEGRTAWFLLVCVAGEVANG